MKASIQYNQENWIVTIWIDSYNRFVSFSFLTSLDAIRFCRIENVPFTFID